MGEVQSFHDIIINHYNDLKKNNDYNDYSLNVTKRVRSTYSPEAARSRADYLASKLENPSSIKFYLKCAWNLTDEYLDTLLAISQTKKDKVRYFSSSAAREMAKNG